MYAPYVSWRFASVFEMFTRGSPTCAPLTSLATHRNDKDADGEPERAYSTPVCDIRLEIDTISDTPTTTVPWRVEDN